MPSKWEGAFNTGRRFKVHKNELPLKPTSIRELKAYLFKAAFKED
jgi:hypothetical protein